jgi:hypothetical protein
VSAGATVMLSPVCTPIGSMFSIEQMDDEVVGDIAHHLQLVFLPPITVSSMRISCTGLKLRPRAATLAKLFDVEAMPPPTPPA